ncbi:hypothetical protein WM46_05880 [Citrobacter freundii complex sp. CFNIH2]|nr:hypothetical protein WM46_05880 [Citrobacter freundii complex sp. CFNIH2]
MKPRCGEVSFSPPHTRVPPLLCAHRSVFPLLSIWVVIKTLQSVCVIFNIHPEENQGIATLSLRRSYVVNPTRSQ